jgi:hypothetical protein
MIPDTASAYVHPAGTKATSTKKLRRGATTRRGTPKAGTATRADGGRPGNGDVG